MAAFAAVEAGDEDPRAFAREIVDIAASATRAHPHAARVGACAVGSPAVADAVHFFTLLHAARPSVPSAADLGDIDWIDDFTAAFDQERVWLTRAAILAGRPRLRDLTRHELIVRSQREAMLTLARSERSGCALGAVAALAADWPAVREALARDRPAGDPDPAIVDAIAAAAVTPGARRAIGFGIVQMLAVHRTLWDLLEAREANSLP